MFARFLFGVLLLTLAVVITVTGLADLGVFLIFGSSTTLSQQIANSVEPRFQALLKVNNVRHAFAATKKPHLTERFDGLDCECAAEARGQWSRFDAPPVAPLP